MSGLAQAATQLAKAARSRGVPVLVEAERVRPGLDELLQEADFICTSTAFPEVMRLHAVLLQLPNVLSLQWIISST